MDKEMNDKKVHWMRVLRDKKSLNPTETKVLGEKNATRYVQVMWINPYLMFLVFVLLIFGVNPPYQVITYIVTE